MSTLQAIIGATTYDLYGRNPYAWVSLTGLGLPPVRRIKERGPQQHGSTDIGFLLDERMLNLTLMVLGETASEAATNRRQLAHILKPLEATPIKLRVTGDDGLVRQIDTNIVGMVDFPNVMPQRMGASQIVIAQFEAANPIPYDPALHNVIFDTRGGGGYQVPFSVPLIYTTGTGIGSVYSLHYAGDWISRPIIYLTGPLTDPVITNLTTDKTLDLTGTTIEAGDTWAINTAYRQWSVTDADGNLRNAALSDESDILNWGFEPDPEATGGINDIRVFATGSTTASRIRVEYYDYYPSLE